MDKESQLFVGTMTQKDILLCFIRNFRSNSPEYFDLPIKHFPVFLKQKNVIQLSSTDSVHEALGLMVSQELSGIPIVNPKDQYLGVILKTDMLFIFKNERYDLVAIKIILAR